MDREQADEIIDELKLSNSNLIDVETAVNNLIELIERLFRQLMRKPDSVEVKKPKEVKPPIRRRKKT